MFGGRALAIMSAGLISACSPYLYAPEISGFSDSLAKLRSSQASLDAEYRTAADQSKADSARRGARPFILATDCFGQGSGCSAMAKPDRPSDAKTADGFAAEALRGHDPGVGPPPGLEAPVPSGCTPPPGEHAKAGLSPLDQGKLISALADYAAALAKVTNAKDRAEFDAGSTALAASTSALAGLMIGGPPGAGGAAVATVVIEAARYGVAVSLDVRRFRTLRCAVLRSQDAVAVLGIIVGTNMSLGVAALASAYEADADAITRNMSARPPAGKWEDNVARLQAIAAKLADLKGAKPAEAAAAMVKANDELAAALRDDRGQVGALATVVGDFAAKVAAIQAAGAAH